MSLDDLLPTDGPIPKVFEPYLVHFFATVTIPWPGRMSKLCLYGDEVEITPSVHAESLDRNGNSWLDIVDRPAEQIRRWGRVRCGLGPWPDDRPRVEPGSLEEADMIEAAWRDAWATPNDDERERRLAEVRAKYGQPPLGNQVLGRFGAQQ